MFPVLALALVAACGGDPATPASGAAKSPEKTSALQPLVKAARAEGSVTVYGPPGPGYREALVEAFEGAYPGIKVEGSFGAITDMFSRVSAERTADRFIPDVWVSGTSPTVTTMKDSGYLVPLDDILLPEVTDATDWFAGKLWWADSKEPLTNLMFQGSVSAVVAYNTDLVKPSEFDSYWDLTEAKWRGKIVGTDIRAPGPGGVPSRFMWKEPSLGEDWFTTFYQGSDIRLESDQDSMINKLAAGEYELGVFLSDTNLQRAMDQGLPVAVVPAENFKEGAPIGPGYGSLAVMDKAPHPNAAALYANWLVSAEGQQAWQKYTKSPSLRIDIPKDGLPEAGLPKKGTEYVGAGGEEYARLTPTAIGDAITQALQAGKE